MAGSAPEESSGCFNCANLFRNRDGNPLIQ
jgi:hypothetical protein